MTEKFVIISAGVYFLGLILSAGASLLNKSHKQGMRIFIASNFFGLLSGLGYFLNFSGETITLLDWEGFFQFSPRLNFLSSIFFLMISSISMLVGIYSLRYLQLYKEEYNPNMVQCLMAIFVLGMQGVLIANNSFSFLFFWEVMSIASFFLVFSDKKTESVKAAFLYFIMTHLGASAILGGFLILGGGSWTFDFKDIGSASSNLSSGLLSLAFLLFVFGFGSKAGLVPFHVWLPEAHPQAPSNISAMMSGLMLKVAVYGFIMITLSMELIPAWAGLVVLCLGLLSGVVGVLYSVVERDIKKAFAYSSIENMGIIFTMLGLAIYLFASGEYSIVAYSIIAFAIFHAVNHAFFKTALFLSSGIVINRVHTKSLERMGGIAKQMPVFSLAFLSVTLGALPLPLFGTFYGEWGLFQNILSLMGEASSSASTIILLLLILSSVAMISGLAIFAMIKIFSFSMLGLPHNVHMEKRKEKEDYTLIMPILFMAGVLIGLGFFAKPIIASIIDNLQILYTPDANLMSVSINISSALTSGVIIFCGLMLYIFQKGMLKNKKERAYHTWDCGQAIDVAMQYSATAFSAPIRFFFLSFIGRKKEMRSLPIVESNPWIRKYDFFLSIRPNWSNALYVPVAKGLLSLAERIRLIQSGRIQYYILFLLLALIITLIFAL